ncbi:MAG: hypothetical protein M3P48_11405, partial [Actinomycetota bacterium]|nr:hypothetical protein [Actinomycetota bacterium]
GAAVRSVATAADLLRGSAGSDVAVVELAQSPAVRLRRVEQITGPDGDAGRRVQLAQYHVPVPGADRWTVLSFSTPAGPVAAELVELFDLVASSFSYVWTPG